MKYIYILLMLILISPYSIGQSNKLKRTTITLSVPDFRDSIAEVELGRAYPLDLNEPHKDTKYIMTNGKITIPFYIDKLTDISVVLNDVVIGRFPATYFLIGPGDSISITIQNPKKLSLNNLKFSGKGSSKMKFLQRINQDATLYASKQKLLMNSSMEEFLIGQDSLLQMIDSAAKANKTIISSRAYEIILGQVKAEYYETLMSLLQVDIYQDNYIKLYKKFILKPELINLTTDTKMLHYLWYDHKIQNYIALLEYGAKNKTSVKG